MNRRGGRKGMPGARGGSSPSMFSECGLSRLVRFRRPDSHKAGEDRKM
jgi:hypothetical protein